MSLREREKITNENVCAFSFFCRFQSSCRFLFVCFLFCFCFCSVFVCLIVRFFFLGLICLPLYFLLKTNKPKWYNRERERDSETVLTARRFIKQDPISQMVKTNAYFNEQHKTCAKRQLNSLFLFFIWSVTVSVPD